MESKTNLVRRAARGAIGAARRLLNTTFGVTEEISGRSSMDHLQMGKPTFSDPSSPTFFAPHFPPDAPDGRRQDSAP